MDKQNLLFKMNFLKKRPLWKQGPESHEEIATVKGAFPGPKSKGKIFFDVCENDSL